MEAIVDFETAAIEEYPNYPPVPVGVAVKIGGQPASYLSWGHPEGNNSTKEMAAAKLATIMGHSEKVVFHNAKFDLAVMEKFFGIRPKHPLQVRDTMFEAYLADPFARSFGLKATADRMLGMAPIEQDHLHDWILHNVRGSTVKNAGAHISLAPVALVAPYAIGDVDRTWALHNHMSAGGEVRKEPYERELLLLPHLMASEKRGIRFDVAGASRDIPLFRAALRKVEVMIRSVLELDDDADLGKGNVLAEALIKTKAVDYLPLTPKGKKISTAKDVLLEHIKDPGLLALLRYKGVMSTCLSTFLEPWLEEALLCNGRIHPSWNQTRGPDRQGREKGTTTGRLSSSRFMNVPSDFEGIRVPSLPPLPHCRQYLLPEEGCLWVKRDYSAQEVRILAHYENGALMEAFRENPDLDPHQFASDVILAKTGKGVGRKKTKIVAFSILYGAGIAALSADMGVPNHEGAEVKNAYLSAFPDVRALIEDVKQIARQGRPVVTVGGRALYSELPKDGKTFEYKLLNHMIQGSGADICKQGVLNYVNDPDKRGEFLACVHDEISISVPEEHVDSEPNRLGVHMSDIKMDVYLKTEAYVGKNWEDADRHKLA